MEKSIPSKIKTGNFYLNIYLIKILVINQNKVITNITDVIIIVKSLPK